MILRAATMLACLVLLTGCSSTPPTRYRVIEVDRERPTPIDENLIQPGNYPVYPGPGASYGEAINWGHGVALEALQCELDKAEVREWNKRLKQEAGDG